jgi:hypothetical protein
MRPTSAFDSLQSRGRRAKPRRSEERRGAYFVDRFGVVTLAVAVTLLALTIADGVLTIELLDTNSEEMNPLMASLLLRGHQVFLIGKYVLTAAGIPFIVVYKNYPMFGSRFRIGYLLPIFVGLYVALISYQARLLDIGREVRWPSRPRASPERMQKRPSDQRLSHPTGLAHTHCVAALEDNLTRVARDGRDLCPIG